MSSEPFDPYHKWLGIPPKDQPANHYRLLGVDLYEVDSDVIENAADQRQRHVRSFQSGPNKDHSQRLLNELSAAKLCLLTPERKAEYDAVLRKQLAPKTVPKPNKIVPVAKPAAPTAVTAVPQPIPQPFAQPLPQPDIFSQLPQTAPQISTRFPAARPKQAITPMTLAIGGGVFLFGIVVLWMSLPATQPPPPKIASGGPTTPITPPGPPTPGTNQPEKTLVPKTKPEQPAVDKTKSPPVTTVANPLGPQVFEPAPKNQWIELLPLVDFDRDTVRGYWTPAKGGVKVEAIGQSRLRLPISLKNASYDLQVEVDCFKEVRGVGILLPVGSKNIFAMLHGRSQEKTSYFYKTGGVDPAQDPRALRGDVLLPNTSHRLEISVRLNGGEAALTTTIDGNKKFEYRGPISEFDSDWGMGNDSHLLSLASDLSTLGFRSCRVRVVNGNAELLTERKNKDYWTREVAGRKATPLTSLKPVSAATAPGGYGISSGTRNPILQGKDCTDFIYAHAHSKVDYNIPPKSQYFTAVAYSGRSPSVKFIVSVDGKKLFEAENQAIVPVTVELPIGAKLLQLECDPLGDLNDKHSCWCFPAFRSAETTPPTVATTKANLPEQKVTFTQWNNGDPPTKEMSPITTHFAGITEVKGHFLGDGEGFNLRPSPSGNWQLSCGGVTGIQIRAAEIASPWRTLFEDRVESKRWNKNQPAKVKLLAKNEGIAVLAGANGCFLGPEHEVRVWLEDGYWYFGGKTNFNTQVEALLFRYRKPGQLQVEVDVVKWTAGTASRKLLSKDEGLCFISGLAGAYHGAGERAACDLTVDNQWYLNGSTGKDSMVYWVTTFKFNDPTASALLRRPLPENGPRAVVPETTVVEATRAKLTAELAKSSAEERLKLGQSETRPLEERYVFLWEARQLAAEKADCALALAASDAMATVFEIDSAVIAVETLQQLRKYCLTSETNRDLTLAALRQAELTARDRPEFVLPLTELAFAAARKCDAELVRRATIQLLDARKSHGTATNKELP